jgi:hypothetical protein
MRLTAAEQAVIAYLRSPLAIRERCGQLYRLACTDQLHYFRCDLSQLATVADYVIDLTREQYPTLEIPFHSRWRHFEVGSASRLARMDAELATCSAIEQAWAKFDLAITSVLLDAGAGAIWRYQEPETGQYFQRSEGLAIASFYLFKAGLFSSNPQNKLQADASGLQHLTEADLAAGMQVHSTNPLIGLQGRVALLQRLGQTLPRYPHLFGTQNCRPGFLVNYLLEQSQNGQLAASTVLSAVLEGLSEIWPARVKFAGVNLGDVWHHSALVGDRVSDHLIPFHKLSQWLTYSLLEPLKGLGLEITGLDALTGLPEYRNGGLCLDMGLLQVKDPSILEQSHLPSSEVIVEWRALTVILLDLIAEAVRQQLQVSAVEMPLVKVLQGGTWPSGRRIAAQLRGGAPPLPVDSDGTVF